MLIARALADRIVDSKHDPDQLLETLLFEIPEEVLEVFHNLADPVEIKVSPKIEALMEEVADAFGLNTLGLTVLMSKILEKTLTVTSRLADYDAA